MDPKIIKHNKVPIELVILTSILFVNGLIISIANLYVLSLHLLLLCNENQLKKLIKITTLTFQILDLCYLLCYIVG